MLQQMRKFASSWVASIFLGMLALSFGVWGIADIFHGTTDTSVASVGDMKIGSTEFQSEYQTVLRNQGARMGTALTAEQARAIGLPQETLQRMISRVAVDQEVNKLGLTASDAAVAEQVKAIQAFQGPSGAFDHATFLQVIQRSGFTEQSFIDAVRSDTARSQLLTGVKQNLYVPTGYARALFDYINEARAAAYVVIPPAAAGSVAPPGDAALEAYVKAHADSFSTPEYRELTYAAITPDDLSNEIKVTDAQLKTEYELRKSDYVVPEKRDIEQITFPDDKTAQAAYDQIQNGKSFEDVAASRGLKPDDINLGELQQADLGSDRGAAAFALPGGTVSKPVKGSFGWVLLKVTKIVPGTNKSFDEVKDALKKNVFQKLAADKISDIVNKFEDAVAGGDTLSEAAAKSGMKAVHVKSVDQAGLAPDGSKADIPAEPQFLAQVFKADVGVASDPFQTEDGSAYAIKVDGVVPPRTRPLDQVRAAATKDWTAEQQSKALLGKAKALADAANKDKSLATVAKTLNAQVQQSGALQRDTPSGDLPAELVREIFSVPPGTAVFGKSAKGDSYIVARVTGVSHPPAMTLADPRYRQFIDQIGQQVGEDIPTSLALAARKQQGVTVNQKMVDQVAGGGS